MAVEVYLDSWEVGADLQARGAGGVRLDASALTAAFPRDGEVAPTLSPQTDCGATALRERYISQIMSHTKGYKLTQQNGFKGLQRYL